MKVVAKKDFRYSLDGININDYQEGVEYEVQETFANKMLSNGYIEVNTQQFENKNTKQDLNEMTVKELQEIAKELEIQGYYDMKKDDLIKAIKENK